MRKTTINDFNYWNDLFYEGQEFAKRKVRNFSEYMSNKTKREGYKLLAHYGESCSFADSNCHIAEAAYDSTRIFYMASQLCGYTRLLDEVHFRWDESPDKESLRDIEDFIFERIAEIDEFLRDAVGKDYLKYYKLPR